LDENSICRKFRHTADDGKSYQVKFYNLEAITSVGYRTDSQRAIDVLMIVQVDFDFEKG